MILQEYDEDLHIRNEKEISYQDGFEEGCRISQDKILTEKKRADEAEKIASEEKTTQQHFIIKASGEK